mmetsp:Transcript_47142/g.108316  ORF Transcript_47142/g.108316 Transcript_47142/m.108316 type:complete len:253 (-) Transcript_47142:48-806(-)
MLLSLTALSALSAYTPHLRDAPRLPPRPATRARTLVCGPSPSKETLMAMLEEGLRSSAKAQQGPINEVLLELERTNPTAAAAQSPLLNGVWSLAYAGAQAPGMLDSPTREIALSLYSSSYSPGLLQQLLRKLPFDASLDEVTITIVSQEAGQPRVSTEAKVSALGASRTIRLKCNLQPLSKLRLREVFIEGEMFGFKSLLPGPLSFSRELCVTYLDDELLVLRDQSGIADVLVRKNIYGTSGEPVGDAPAAS